MKNILLKSLLISLVLFFNGCLWVTRVPFATQEKFDDDGTRTNVVYRSLISDIRLENQNKSETNRIDFAEGVYPLTKMRCSFTYYAFKEKDFSKLKGRDLYQAKWNARVAPVVSILIWIGEPLDLIIDTLILPWDISE